MRILLIGRDGQIGWEIARVLPAFGELHATARAQLNLSDPDAIRRVVRESKPEVIVNAAAYTQVDQAEAARETAMQINAVAPGVLAEEAKRLGALLVHFSTDYVFDGRKDSPYLETDATNPLNVYGASKLEGERALIASGCRFLLLRTSWVYSQRGRNFMFAILRAAREAREPRVVDDQTGAPTSASAVAKATAKLMASRIEGLYHMSCRGRTTWHGFACEILRIAAMRVPVHAVGSDEYSAPARRPRNSLLDNSKLERASGVALPDWLNELRTVLVPVL